MLQPKDLQRYKAWQQQALAAGFGGAGGNYGSLPSDSHRVATFQDQNTVGSQESSPVLDGNNLPSNQMGFPWYPPPTALPPAGANNFYADLMQNRGRANGNNPSSTNSNNNNNSETSSSGFPPPFMFPPYDYRYAIAGGYNPRVLPTTTASSSSTSNAFGYSASPYGPFGAGATTGSNESSVPPFPFMGFPGGNAFPPNINNPASAYMFQNPLNQIHHSGNSSTSSNHNISSSNNNGNSHPRELDGTQDGQTKRRKGSSSPASADYNSRLSTAVPPQTHPPDQLLEEGLLKSSASSSEGGLDVLLAVAGTIDDSPKEH